MDYTPLTSFRRTMSAADLKQIADPDTSPLPPQGINKWEVLRELGTGRTVFGLSDRDLAVLSALLSFHPTTVLGGNDDALIVYPSNAALCERLNGMPCSTMRRHLSHILKAGFLARQDSPNGKRYVRRYGDEKVAFGFDLTPLVQRFAEICRAAKAVKEAADRFARLREVVSLMRRDLAGLAAFGQEVRPDLGLWDQCQDLAALTARDLRRKLDLSDLQVLEAELKSALDRARTVLEPQESEEMSTKDVPSEQHYQNSNKDSYDLEPCLEKAKAEGQGADPNPIVSDDSEDTPTPTIPLALVTKACKEFLTYSDRPVRHWHDLVRVADDIRPMMGISPSAWQDAKQYMGPEQAAVVVVAMLDRFDDIRSPGGYLRSLTDKARNAAFSCAPMVMAQLRRAGA